MNVTLTCSFSSPDFVCSLEGTESHIVPLLSCKLDMTLHLPNLGVSSGQQRSGDENVNEFDLILNRAGHFVARKGRGGGGGRGYFRNFWVGMCRWDPGTLSLYQS